MSTPETPPQTPPAPVAADAAPAPIEPSALPSEGASNGAHEGASRGADPAPHGHESHGDESHGAESHGHESHGHEAGPEDASSDEGSSDEASADEGPTDGEEAGPRASADGSAGPAPGGEKKRRRRRRKKKPGQGAAVEGAAVEGQAPATEGAPTTEVGAEPDADAARAGKPGDKRDRRKEKKHQPPRERPPVNAGDIVFGKILEITDDAIFVDIPGKAHAIFDRHEMLLPDDEDAQRGVPTSARAPTAAPPLADATETTAPGEEPAADAAAAEIETETESAVAREIDEGGPPVEGVDATAATATAEPEAIAAPEGEAPDATPEVSPSSPSHASAAEPAPTPPREPKVPRVILEVGADFIGVVLNEGARGGLVVLTHHPHRAEKIKPVLEKALQDKTTILGLVTGIIKGGIEVDVDGLRAFAPGSHVDLRMGADLSYLLGERLPFFVTQYAKRGRDVVLSRKTLIEEEARKTRSDALAKLKVGEELDGVVRSVVPFGAFVDVGGVEGLVPLQEMSHNRADGPSDVFKAGEPTRVKVIKIDDRGKVWLSRKATIPDPWQQVAQKYALGTRHAGKIARLQPFGAFVELEPGVDGLIHTQDLSIKRIEVPSDVVKVGDAIEVVVAHLDPMQHKIALHPAPQGDMANETPQRVAPHKAVKAKVVLIESGGLVVRILGVTGRNARGYITSAGTGTPRGTELRKAFNIGQEVEAKVVEIDPRRGEIKLSIKAHSEEQERSAYQHYRQQLKAEARFTLADLLTKKSPR